MAGAQVLPEFRDLLEGVDDGITVQDRAGRLVYANALAAKLIGFDSVEGLMAASPGEIVASFEVADSDGRPLPLSELPGRQAFELERPVEKILLFRRRDGGGRQDERWARVRAKPIRDANGQVAWVMNLFHDILETRQKEQALELSREWFSMVLRSVGDAVIATDAKATVTFINPVAEAMTGWLRDEALGRPLEDVFVIVNEETRQPVDSPVHKVLRHGIVVGLANHTILIRKDGTEVAIDDSAAPILAGDKRLAGTVLVFRDVSAARAEERRRAFIARATEELNSGLDYRKTLATVAQLAVPQVADWCGIDILEGDKLQRLAVAHIDPGKIRLVEDIGHRYPVDLDQPTGAPNVLRTGKAEMIANISDEMLEAAAKDPEHLRLIRQLQLKSFLAVPLNVRGKTMGVISLAMAESGRRHDEADLALATALADRAAVAVDNARLFHEAVVARSEAQVHGDMLRSLVMMAPAAICLLRGRELIYELVNEPFLKLFGGRNVIGRSARDVLGQAPELEQVWATGEPAITKQYPFTFDWSDTGAPETRYFDAALLPLKDAQGRFDRIATFSVDVTDQVLARQRLEAARAEAELANRAKDEFLAMLGHELRNPLAPILTALHIMKMRTGDAPDKERIVIERQVRHVVRLVDDLLDVSRITRGKLELHREPVDMNEVIAKAIEMAGPLIEQREHHLDTAVDPDLLVEGDGVRLAQVVANLLTNAAKYTEKRGHITLSARANGDWVTIGVRDNGMGISGQLLPHVFDLFTQGTQASDRSSGGLGLGLAIVKSLTEMHGGRASASSPGLGKGSEFRIMLPRLTAAQGEALAAAKTPTKPRNVAGIKVLIVDDNVDARELLQEALELSGHLAVVAEDGPSALTLAAKEMPDIALLDIGLPVMDGYELARRMRTLPGLAGIKLIALTGYGQTSDRDRAHEAGFDMHLVKPISLDVVEQRINELMRPRKPRA